MEFIDGVILLREGVIYGIHSGAFLFIISVIITGLAIVTLLAFPNRTAGETIARNVFTAFFSMVSITFLISGIICLMTPVATKYEATVTEKVDMLEFYNTYNVIEQDGMIWTIRVPLEEKGE